MVKKKNNYLIFLIALVIILIFTSGIKNLKNHYNKEYLVVNNRILESAKECFIKKDCEGNIKLKDLYDKNYLEIQVDPSTKENMDDNICITYNKDEAIFCNE